MGQGILSNCFFRRRVRITFSRMTQSDVGTIQKDRIRNSNSARDAEALSSSGAFVLARISVLFTGHALFPIRLCSQNVRNLGRSMKKDRMGLRRVRRLAQSLVAVAIGAWLVLANQSHAADAAFQQWLGSLWPEAQSLGVARATFATATQGLEPDLTLPDLVIPGRKEAPPGQPEFVLTPADYLKESSFDRLAGQGRKLLDQYRPTLD